jgi:hypothetical protein
MLDIPLVHCLQSYSPRKLRRGLRSAEPHRPPSVHWTPRLPTALRRILPQELPNKLVLLRRRHYQFVLDHRLVHLLPAAEHESPGVKPADVQLVLEEHHGRV